MPMIASCVAATWSRGNSPAPDDAARDAGAGDAEGCLQRRARGIRQPRRHRRHDVDRRRAQQVVRGDPGEEPAIAHPQRDPGGLAAVRGESVDGADRVQERGAQLVLAGQRDARRRRGGRAPRDAAGRSPRSRSMRPSSAHSARQPCGSACRRAHRGGVTARDPRRARRAPRRDPPRPRRHRAGRRGRAQPPTRARPAASPPRSSRLKPRRARWVRALDRSLADMRQRSLRASRGCSSARSASPASGIPATPGAC